MAAAGTSSAQSSITLFGVVDTTLEHGSASGGSSITRLTNSGYNSSRLALRGTEDLGGGLWAGFWLEGGLSTDDGSAGGAVPAGNQTVTAPGNLGLNFNRRSTVSLASNWGEVRAGRDYTPSFWNLVKYDPFLTLGVGSMMGLYGAAAYGVAPGGAAGVLVRASNSLQYIAPSNLGGFYGNAMMWMGKNVQNGAATEHDGGGYGARVGYTNGPFDVALAYSRTRYAQTDTTGDFKTWNLGGQWDFGVAALMAEYGRDTRESTTPLQGRQWVVGANIPVGPGSIRASYSDYRITQNAAGLATPNAGKLALGYVHNLSKRTALYATFARVKNSNGSAIALGGASMAAGAANGPSAGYDLGVRHSF